MTGERFRFRRSKAEMIVVSHQRKANHFDSPLPMGIGYGVEKRLIAALAAKCWLSCPSSVHVVIDGCWKLNSQWTGRG
jgi:hypothetical protein